MLFNSISFAIFLPIVFALYWAIPNKFRWIVILASSYYFYMSWSAKYIVLILFITAVSYFAAISIGKVKNRKLPVYAAVIFSLALLFVFKYFNFFSRNASKVFALFSIQLHPMTLKLVLPVGISFYTFQALSYVVDVYKGKVEAERHFGKYAAFISFFPQLVAGPIERSENLLPQIKAEHSFDYDKATYGLKLMAWGFVKKIVIADNLAPYVDKVYNDVLHFQGFALVLATFFFAIQIYCDFSGYSDIAIGTAKLFGIDLMTNFKSPYFSASIKEFWSRWHISLSTWFRDYVYIPLGGNRCSKARRALNLLATFLLSGLWHGANWTFVIWGGIHGLVQVLEKALPKRKGGALEVLRVPLVFAVVSVAWIFFRAQTVSQALYILRNMLGGISSPMDYFVSGYGVMEITGMKVALISFSLALLSLFDFFSLKNDCIAKISSLPVVARWCVYLLVVLLIIFMHPVSRNTEFIYFQF